MELASRKEDVGNCGFLRMGLRLVGEGKLFKKSILYSSDKLSSCNKFRIVSAVVLVYIEGCYQDLQRCQNPDVQTHYTEWCDVCKQSRYNLSFKDKIKI